MRDPNRLVRLGVFGAAHGIGGEVRINSFTADPKSIAAYGALTDAKAKRRFALEVVRALRNGVVVARVEGVSSREGAEALAGVELFARRSELPPPGEDEYYYDDLIGLKAVTRAGAPIGRVVALLNYGAGDILEIAPAGGGETQLMPFSKSVVLKIDFEANEIVIQPPAEIDGERE